MKAKSYSKPTSFNWLFAVLMTLFAALTSDNKVAAQILTEDFSYTSGAVLSANGYTVLANSGVNVITVTTPGLTYTGSPASGVGNAATLTTSGEDISRTFSPAITTGSAYISFLMRLNSAQATGDYFFTLMSGTSFTVRFYARSSGTGFVTGISKSSGTATYETTEKAFGTTYLVVLKYTYNASTNDDAVSSFINPVLGAAEPTPTIGPLTAGAIADASTIDRFGLRQGSATAAPSVVIDGVRIGSSWASVTASNGPVVSTVTTTAASSINGTTAVSGGNVTADGGATVTRRGLVYSTSAITDTTNTTGGGLIIDATGGTGAFTANLNGLSLSTNYNIRAFAVNSVGVSYGSNLTFTTLSEDIANAPTAQPTNYNVTSLTCNGMTVNWTPASPSVDGYIVLRTTGGTAPNTDPVSTTAYTVGQIIGNATVAYVGSGTSFTLSSLIDGTTNNFKIYSYNGSGSSTSYLTPSPLTGTTSTLAPSALTATAATDIFSNAFTANWNGTSASCANNFSLTFNGVEGFENALTLFTASGTGGQFLTGTNSTGTPATAPFASSGTYGYAVVNGTGILTSMPFNTTGVSSSRLSFNLSALSYLVSTNGIESSDSIRVDISPDNGTTWYPTLSVVSSATSGSWAFGAATIASTAYDGDNTIVGFSGNGTATGIGTVVVTGLPSVAQLRVRITLKNNSINEAWVMDDFRLSNTIAGVTGTSYSVPNTIAGALYNYTINSVGTGATTASNVISLNTLAAAVPTFGTSSVANITNTSADLTVEVASVGSTASISSRGIAYKTSAGVTATDNPQADASATTGSFTQTRTLAPETRYYYRGYAVNAEGTGLSAEENFFTLSNPPTVQASSLSTIPFSSSQLDLNWSSAEFPASGATAKRYILMVATAPNTPSFTGVNGAAPTVGANTTIVDQNIGGDVVSASAIGLSSGTSYNFLLVPYTWDGVNAGTYNYLTASAPTASGTTSTVAPPSLSASTVSAITATSALLGATLDTDGGADIVQRGTVYSTSSPVNITNNTLDEGGTSLGAFSHVRSDLQPMTKYFFAGYAVNAGGSLALSPQSSFFTLASSPLAHATSFIATPVSGTQINLSWNAATFANNPSAVNGYLVLRSTFPDVPGITNINGQAPVAAIGTTILSSTALTSLSSTGLTGNTQYNYEIIPYSWNGVNDSTYAYLINAAPSASATTFASAPVAQPIGLSFSNITCNGMTLTWRNATTVPSGYLVLRSSGATAPDADPVSGTEYSIGATLGNATVVYIGADTTFIVSSLIDATNYNYKIYSYNGSGNNNVSYLSTLPLSGAQMTSIPAAPAPTSGTNITLTEFQANWSASACAGNGYLLDVSAFPNFFDPSVPSVTLASEGFESGTSLFTASGTGGSVRTGSSATGDRPASSPFFTEGTSGFGAANGTSVLTSSAINTSTAVAPQLTMNIAAFSIGSTANGPDATFDQIKVEISPDGGTTWYNTATFNGNNSSYWPYSAPSSAVVTYDGDNTAVNFQAPTSGNNSTTGYSSLTINNLPNVADMRVRITMQTNSSAELWAIDDVKISARTGSFVSTYQNYAVTAPSTSQLVSGLTLNTTYYYRVRGVGQNANSNYSNTMSVTTEAGFATLSAPSASNITNNSADLSATVLTAGSGAGITARGTVYNTAAGVTASNNALDEGGTTVDAFTQTRTGLSPETRYYFAAYAINSFGTGLSTESSLITLSNPPTSAASSFTASTFSGDQINLSWSPATFPSTGATVKGYVILRALYPTVPALTNGNAAAPVADANTTIISTMSANDTSMSAEGLAGVTRYNFAIVPFTWNGTEAATYNYFTSSIPTADATTLTAVTALAPTGFTASGVTCDGMAVNWTTGEGADGTLVLQTTGATAPNTNPAPGVVYTVGQTIGNATVAYVGSGSNFTLSSLLDNTTYRFKLFSYNGSGTGIGYLTSSTLSGSQTTSLADAPVANAATAITASSFVSNWSAATCASNYKLFVYRNVASNIAGWTFPSSTVNTSDTIFSNSNNLGRSVLLMNTTTNTSTGTILTNSGTTTQSLTSATSTNQWVTAGSRAWQVIINTNGQSNLKLSSAQYSSSTGPRDFAVQYKIGANGTWTDVSGSSITVGANWTLGLLNNLQLPSACDNVDSLYIRWITTSGLSTTGIAIGSGGTSRIDNILITGEATQFVSGYDGAVNAGTSSNVNGLSSNTTYYYYVQSVGASGSSSLNSNTIQVTTYADQAVADYRTKASGAFSDANIWEYNYDGTNYIAASVAPGTTNNIMVRSSDSVYIDTDVQVGAGKSFVVNGIAEGNTRNIFGSGTFTLAPAATFYCGSPSGLTTGNITTTTKNLSDSANYVFNGAVAQTSNSGLPSILKGNVIISNPEGFNWSSNRTISAPGSFIVKGNGKVTFGTGINTASTNVNGTGNFVAESGSTLIITSSTGISTPGVDTVGCIRLTGTRSFGSNVNYNFTKNQVAVKSRIGTAFGTEITSIGKFTVNNPFGVELNNSNITINDSLLLVTGKLATGANKVTIGSTAGISRTDTSWVIGNLEKNIAAGSTSATFELGADSINYTPVTVAFGNVSTAGSLTTNAVAGAQPQLAGSVLSSTKRLNFYAEFTGSGIAFDTYTATINYKSGNVLVGANTNTVIAGNYDGTTWTYPSVASRTSTSITLNGLTSLGSLAVAEVNCTIAATASANTPVCSGDAITLTGGSTGGYGVLTYSWSGPNSFSSSLQNPVINNSTTANAGSYTITVTDAFGCSNTATANVAVNNCNSTLNVKAFLEGYYRSPSNGPTTFAVANAGAAAYTIASASNPTINLIRGVSYTFNISASGHPFWISTTPETGSNDAYNTGVNNNGIDNGTITFTVPQDAPDMLYYNCEYHSMMSGMILVSNPSSGTMAATLYDLGISTDVTATDSIEVNLWSASSLGNATPNYSVKVLLHTDGTATAIFPAATLGNAYYVAIKHRNSIETWSANTVTIDAVTNYDFTTGLNKAYGDGATPSMKSLGGNVFGFYGGDVNQDGTVDGSDMNDVDNNTTLGAFGYDNSDANGDGATDGLDMNVVDNNTQIGLFYARPY